MEIVPEDIYGIIMKFLSFKERIIVSEVCKNFLNERKSIYIIINRLENALLQSHSIQMKLSHELILTMNNNFDMYTDHTRNGIHSVFRINNHSYTRCINAYCREKRLENIYFSKKSPVYHQHYYGWNFYHKRTVPYCLNCFNMWGVDAPSNYIQN